MRTSKRKLAVIVAMFTLILGGWMSPGQPRDASGADDLSRHVQDAGKAIEKSVNHAADKTAAYLKSDAFHRKVTRVVDGAETAVRNAGHWVGNTIDSMSKKDRPAP